MPAAALARRRTASRPRRPRCPAAPATPAPHPRSAPHPTPPTTPPHPHPAAPATNSLGSYRQTNELSVQPADPRPHQRRWQRCDIDPTQPDRPRSRRHHLQRQRGPASTPRPRRPKQRHPSPLRDLQRQPVEHRCPIRLPAEFHRIGTATHTRPASPPDRPDQALAPAHPPPPAPAEPPPRHARPAPPPASARLPPRTPPAPGMPPRSPSAGRAPASISTASYRHLSAQERRRPRQRRPARHRPLGPPTAPLLSTAPQPTSAPRRANARTSRSPVSASSAATRNAPASVANPAPDAGRYLRGHPRQHERRRGDSTPISIPSTGERWPISNTSTGNSSTAPANGSRMRRYSPSQRLDVADQPRQHVTGLTEPKPARRTPRQPPEKPHPQIRQRPEHRIVGDQPIQIAQHHARRTEPAQQRGDRHRSASTAAPIVAPDSVINPTPAARAASATTSPAAAPAGLAAPQPHDRNNGPVMPHLAPRWLCRLADPAAARRTRAPQRNGSPRSPSVPAPVAANCPAPPAPVAGSRCAVGSSSSSSGAFFR